MCHSACAVLTHLVLGINVGMGVEKNACCFYTAPCSCMMERRPVRLKRAIASFREIDWLSPKLKHNYSKETRTARKTPEPQKIYFFLVSYICPQSGWQLTSVSTTISTTQCPWLIQHPLNLSQYESQTIVTEHTDEHMGKFDNG
jgi:hypothetical protein